MVRRGEARATIRRLRDGDLRSNAELLACFVCEGAEIANGQGTPIALAPHTLAWLENRARGTRVLQLSGHAPRGWWIEAHRTARNDYQAD